MTLQARPSRAKPRPAPVTCKKVTSLIADYLNHDLDPDLLRKFDRHIRGCPDCVGFLNTYRKTLDALRSLRYDDIPPDLQEKTLGFLRKKTKRVSRSH